MTTTEQRPEVAPHADREWVTIAEAAKALGVSAVTLRRWDRNGRLVARRHPSSGYRIYHRAGGSPLCLPPSASFCKHFFCPVSVFARKDLNPESLYRANRLAQLLRYVHSALHQAVRNIMLYRPRSPRGLRVVSRRVSTTGASRVCRTSWSRSCLPSDPRRSGVPRGSTA